MNRKLLLFVLAIAAVAGGVFVAIKNMTGPGEPTPQKPTRPAPAVLTVSLPALNVYWHDAASYTEGLEFYKGVLYESAGETGKSFLATYDYKTGKQLSKKVMGADIFGEGITILNDTLYMLTYKNGKMFVRNPVTLEETGNFAWTYGEGWGMTNDGKSIIANTGGSSILFFDPHGLKLQRNINVTDEYGPVSNVNEMEYVNGYIYANIFGTDIIIKIDPQTGNVVARTDLSSLYPEYNHFSENATAEGNGKVMNGIAYNPDTKTFLLTGKNWPKMFEVKMD